MLLNEKSHSWIDLGSISDKFDSNSVYLINESIFDTKLGSIIKRDIFV